MRFNQLASIWTFVAAILAYVIIVLVSRLQGQPELPAIGILLYAILTLIASITTGYMIPVKKRMKNKVKNKDGKIIN